MLLRSFLALTILVAAGCAVRPDAVRRMDATRIQDISDYRLCDAAAVNLDERGQRYPVIEGEIARRGISCDEHIAAVVSDCSRLRVLNSGMDRTEQGIIFTVQNDSDQPQNFRIRHDERGSRMFTIGPATTEQFGMTSDPNVERLEEAVELTEGDGGIELLECRPARDSYRFNYRPQAGNQPGAGGANEAAPQTSATVHAVRRRATRNVNMRAGPGTNHAVVRTLRPGEEVSVIRVVGTWCECVTGGGVRAYVSCALLSAPSDGRTSRAPRAEPSVPRIPQGTPYSEVRRRLIAGGWSPYRMPIKGCFFSDPRCDALPERIACATTGSAGCVYSWRQGQRFLLVTAIGERTDQMFSEARLCRRLTNSRRDPSPTCQ